MTVQVLVHANLNEILLHIDSTGFSLCLSALLLHKLNAAVKIINISNISGIIYHYHPNDLFKILIIDIPGVN